VRNLNKTIIISLTTIWIPATAFSLPIGFGINHGDIEYGVIKNEDHAVYHDKRAPNEGAMIQNSLTSAKPVLQKWFDRPLTLGLPVISSAVSDNASFANFITNSIELQTLGQGNRDLYWHEYTHTNMYHHFFNWFGPAGSLLHLPWMAAWFIEGLAESMSVSTGSDIQYGIERYQALTGDWPTYDRMHSLYQDPQFFLTGYATSGAFVSWIMRQGKPQEFPAALDDFYHYTMPWWWPWIAVPFNGFTPMNKSMENYAGTGGEDLYVKYKEEAAAYWKTADNGPVLSATEGRRKYLTSLSGLNTQGNDTRMILTDDNYTLRVYNARFDETTGWMTSTAPGDFALPKHPGSFAFVKTPDMNFAIVKDIAVKTGFPTHRIVAQKQGTDTWTTIKKRPGLVSQLFFGGGKLAWFEEQIELTKICWLPLTNLKAKATCIIVDRMPRSIYVIGQKLKPAGNGLFEAEQLWIRRTEQTLQGDRYEILIWDLQADKIRTIPYKNGGKPLEIAFAGKQKWLLTAEETRRSLRLIGSEGQCEKLIRIADLPMSVAGLDDGRLVIGLYAGRSRTVRKIDPNFLKSQACYPSTGHMSPLVYAMNQKIIPDLETTLAATNPWVERTSIPEIAGNIENAAPLNETKPPFGGEMSKSTDSINAPWHPRPIFLFPFIGAEDPLGTQYGFVSVPLMDHLQDETLRVSLLYGAESHFPNTDITLTSTRFWPTIDATLYRSQTWDGNFQNPSNRQYYNIYLDEKGGKVNSNFRLRFTDQSVGIGLGIKLATLKRYLGPFIVKEGPLNEPNISISHFRKFHELSLLSSVNSRFTTKEFNRNFDYNVVGASVTATYQLGFLDSSASAGIDGSRTRGKEMRELKEVYSPLRTFIPGSGGGYNQNNIPLLIGSGSIFSHEYGDTQMRNKLNWTCPLNSDIDKWIGLAYIERLDFTAFINYGGAWYNGRESMKEKLAAAHGYNLDLQLENKGIRFNLGAGVGQVFHKDFQVYLTSGFDALF
jgi:hypothetical protein